MSWSLPKAWNAPDPEPPGAAFNPDWASPPGETIVDLLSERGRTQAELADRTHIKHVDDLMTGRAAITPDVADRLSRVLGSTPEFWLARDAQYQAAVKRQRAWRPPGRRSLCLFAWSPDGRRRARFQARRARALAVLG